MSFDLKLFSGKLNRCRANLQLELSEVCAKLGIDADRMLSLEEGKILPTGDEILIFADFYKQDYQFFISNEYRTAIEQVQILYRKHGSDFSPADRWAIQEFLYLCECEQTVYDLIEKDHFSFKPLLRGEFFKTHGIETAEALRLHLGLATDTLINDPYLLFRKLGFHIFRRKLENSAISGLFIMHPRAGKCILVNYEEDIFRQNFTLTHEVAHALFDSGEEINVSFDHWDKADLKEIRANTFASNFLIPRAELLKRKYFEWNEDILQRLALELKVNIQPLLIALKNAGVLSYEQGKAFSSTRIPMSLKTDPELSGLSEKRFALKKDLLERGLSNHYLQVCYQAYREGHLSAQRLSELLLVQEGELPELLSLYHLNLIYDN